jgi:hypothetical protein
MAKNSVLSRENRVMINAIKNDITEIKKDIGNIYEKLEKTSNHLSRRLPPWASALFMIFTAILGGLIVKALG